MEMALVRRSGKELVQPSVKWRASAKDLAWARVWAQALAF